MYIYSTHDKIICEEKKKKTYNKMIYHDSRPEPCPPTYPRFGQTLIQSLIYFLFFIYIIKIIDLLFQILLFDI